MKQLLLTIFVFSLYSNTLSANSATWRETGKNIPVNGERKLFPNEYKIFALNDAYMKSLLFLMQEGANGTVISLPSPAGKMVDYRIMYTPVMPAPLAAKYPGIRNFTAVQIDNPAITAKVNYTYYGFNAMVYDGSNTYLVDPYTNLNDGYYICYYKKDYPSTQSRSMSCGVTNRQQQELGTGNAEDMGSNPPEIAFKTNGSMQKTFRLALSCTGEYAIAVAGVNPPKQNVLSAITNTLTRLNGILEREMSVTLQLVPNNDTLIYLDPATDSFLTAHNNSINNATLNRNQQNIDKVIGNGNYDIGHVFCTNPNGLAFIESLCDPNDAAKGATGSANPVGDPFDVNYVIHEIGHQLGAEHTFNYGAGVCGGTNPKQLSAFEPGSGSTIMGYAGLCAGNDMQMDSDDYFHSHSLYQMNDYISGTDILTCGSTVLSTNDIPVVPNIATAYNIPIGTPFELEAPQVTDLTHDSISYCWEQFDLGDFGKGLDATVMGPIIRSFKPVASRWRTFPMLDSIKRGVNSYRSEKMPSITRELNIRLTVRDMYNGWGTHNITDTSVKLYATSTAGPFKINGLGNGTDLWRPGQTYTVKWDVANTTAAPVSCNAVNIFLSTDDGLTWQYTLASNTPNDGSEDIVVPAGIITFGARIKVKGAGNVFFDINDAAFKINNWPDGVAQVLRTNEILVYPIPAKNTLHIATGRQRFDMVMHNSLGQVVYQGTLDGELANDTEISVSNLSAGIYYLTFKDLATGAQHLKRVAIQ